MLSQLASLPALLLLCSVMLVGTYLAGLLPLQLPLTRRSLKLLQIAGSGMLLGASMTVVLPEGVGALWRATDDPNEKLARAAMGIASVIYQTKVGKTRDQHGDGDHDSNETEWDPEKYMGMAMISGFLVMFLINQFTPHSHSHSHSHHLPTRNSRTRSPPETWRLRRTSDAGGSMDRNQLPDFDNFSASTKASRNHLSKATESTQNGTKPIPEDDSADTDREGELNFSSYSPESLPQDYDTISRPNQDEIGEDGTSLVSPLLRRSPSELSRRTNHNNPNHDSDRGYEGNGALSDALPSLIGLCLHAAADGIAMGATAGSSDEGLKAVVFLAIIVHKAPAAFGLCTLFMARKLRKLEIQKGLALFSLSTPLGAIITYLLLTLFLPPVPLLSTSKSNPAPPSISSKHIGLALTFSGGTFLYVALHAMQETTSDDEEEEINTNASRFSSEKRRRVIDSLVLLAGATAPKLMQGLVGHHH